MTFSEQVYQIVRQVPEGKVTTYRDVAHAIDSKAYRAIGQVLKNNPSTDDTPCHRIISSTGKIGGYFGSTDRAAVNEKKDRLTREGVIIHRDTVDPSCILSFGDLMHAIDQ